MSTILSIDKHHYKHIRKYLLQNHLEQVCFLFYNAIWDDRALNLSVVDYYLAIPQDYTYQSAFHIELNDACQAKIIKKAWDQQLSLGEIHSHPTSYKAYFSSSDISGFKEFVPHVWWRLKKGPYIAIILSQRDVDAIAWVKDPEAHEQVKEIRMGSDIVYPSNNTIKLLQEKKWIKKSFPDKSAFSGLRDRKK